MRYGSVRLMTGIVLAAGLLAGGGGGALGQSTLRFTPSPWDGLYFGVHGGYGWGENDAVEDPANPVAYNGAGNSWDYDTDGYLVGVHAGLNWESNRLILGLEAAFGYMAIEGDGPDPGSTGLDTFATQGDGYYADITARIGFAPENMLYYMKGGAAFADFGWSVEDACSTGPCGGTVINAANDDIESGWTAGVGIGWAFTQHTSLRVEYAYYDFGSIRMAGTSGANTYRWEQDVTLHTVTAGISFMF